MYSEDGAARGQRLKRAGIGNERVGRERGSGKRQRGRERSRGPGSPKHLNALPVFKSGEGSIWR